MARSSLVPLALALAAAHAVALAQESAPADTSETPDYQGETAPEAVVQPAYQPQPPSYAALEVASSPHRVVGFGTSGGIGIGAIVIPNGRSGAGGFYEFGSIEALIYLTEDLSLDIAIPLGSNLFMSSETGFGALFWQTDFFLDFRVGGPVARLFGGPGLGIRVVTGTGGSLGGATGFSLRVPAMLGLELSPDTDVFAFRIFAEPFVEFLFGAPGGFAAFFAGALAKIGFYGFVMQG